MLDNPEQSRFHCIGILRYTKKNLNSYAKNGWHTKQSVSPLRSASSKHFKWLLCSHSNWRNCNADSSSNFTQSEHSGFNGLLHMLQLSISFLALISCHFLWERCPQPSVCFILLSMTLVHSTHLTFDASMHLTQLPPLHLSWHRWQQVSRCLYHSPRSFEQILHL